MKTWIWKVTAVLALGGGLWGTQAMAQCDSSNPSPACTQMAVDYEGQQAEQNRRVFEAQRNRKPSSYGAVAMDAQGGSYGYASKQAALNDCGSKGCKVIRTYWNSCVAMAWGLKSVGGGYSMIVTNPNLNAAQNEAYAGCSKQANNCKILVSDCSLPS